MRTTKGYCSECAIAREETGTVTYGCQRLEGSLTVNKPTAVPSLESVGIGT
jgi:hypothetical protein